MKVLFRILPWALVLLFFGLWQLNKLENGLECYYGSHSFMQISKNMSQLEEYVIKKRDFESDLIAFEALKLIHDKQYDGKYVPWISTDLGLVKFDSAGFITAICQDPANIGEQDCPPQL